MTHAFEQHVAAAWPPAGWIDVPVVVAVSGGADSVALLRSLASLASADPGRLVVAHLNHGLRPEAEEDQAFVMSLARRLRLRFVTEKAEISPRGGEGPEGAARRARMWFLKRAARAHAARHIATGHTADDQAETVLHRVLRGTGLAGLAGMPFIREVEPGLTIVRPLLSIRREEALAYLAELPQPFRCDASNSDLRFTRNRIRHQLLPQLREHFNPAVDDALLRLARLAAEAQQLVSWQIAPILEERVHYLPGETRIDLAGLKSQPPYLVQELLRAVWKRQGWPLRSMSREKWRDLAHWALAGDTGRMDLPGGVRAQIDERGLALSLEGRQANG